MEIWLRVNCFDLGAVAHGALELYVFKFGRCYFLSDPCVFGYIYGVWLWSVAVECGYGVWLWSVAMECGYGVWLWSVAMKCGYGVWL